MIFTSRVVIGILLVGIVGTFATNFPQVTISDGIIRGNFWTTKSNRTFSAFTSIPYAEPPIGNLRFRAPVPKKPWKGVLNATKVHAVCPQRDVFTQTTVITGDEDCLFLNVYTPKVDNFEAVPLPVMVYIHGGGFLSGTGNSLTYGPDILLDKDIVLVIMNYRLGPLGFLSTGDEVVPGNNGLKDQNLALKWVHKNIKSFGGDTQHITLFGHSAGAASVHYHMLSPLSRGLFHNAIMQSGNALGPWAFGENNETVRSTEKLAKSLNCPIKPGRDMIDCLRKIGVNTIIGQDKIFIKWDYDPVMPFRPTIESNVEGAFLTDHPLNIMKTGKCVDIPVITGMVRDEGSFKAAGMKNLNLLNDLAKRFDEIAPYSVIYGRVNKDTNTVTKAIREFYFEDRKIEDSLGDVIKIYSDSWLTRAFDEFVTLFKKYYTQSVYTYLLTYRGSLSFTMMFQGGDEDYGVCHGDELFYLFPAGYSLRPGWIPTENDQKMMDVYSTLWTNFALNGNPNPVTKKLSNLKWEPYSTENEEYLQIFPGALKMKNKVFQNRTTFWRKLKKE